MGSTPTGVSDFPTASSDYKMGSVRFVKISHNHGDRTKAAEILDDVKKLEAK